MRQLKITKQVTNRESYSLDKYLQEIAKTDLIDEDEEVRLAKLIKKGEADALNKLVKANLRFVVSVAKQYQNQGLSLPDLINEGNMGLIKAAERFDETRGFKFISYAVWWIRQSILQALAEHARVVRLPLNKIGSMNRITRTYTSLEQQFERSPTTEEIAEELNISESEVKQSLISSHKNISMDAPINAEEDSNLYDILLSKSSQNPDKELLIESLRKEIERSLAQLSNREANILRMYYGLNGKHPHTLDEIGEDFYLTRERVRQIKENALKQLKTKARCKILKTYLG